MARIAVAQTARGQVQHTDEQGDEHVSLVALACDLVDVLHDACWVALIVCKAAEVGVNNGHYQ